MSMLLSSDVVETTAVRTEDTRHAVEALIAMVSAGQILPALDTFYGADVVMQDNGNAPCVGRDANRERERAFFSTITVHGHRARQLLVDGNRAVIHWLLEFSDAGGQRFRLDQLAQQEWAYEDGALRIVAERFFYDPATLPVAA